MQDLYERGLGSGAADKAAVWQVSDDETTLVLSCQSSGFGHVVMPEIFGVKANSRDSRAKSVHTCQVL